MSLKVSESLTRKSGKKLQKTRRQFDSFLETGCGNKIIFNNQQCYFNASFHNAFFKNQTITPDFSLAVSILQLKEKKKKKNILNLT